MLTTSTAIASLFYRNFIHPPSLLIDEAAGARPRSMSSGDERSSRENSPTIPPISSTSSRDSSQGSISRRDSGPSNVIEFVDSQDPNVKSAIQRHTAYHSAAQRREARLRSLRRGSQSRFLEWSRRPVSAPPNEPSASSSSTSSSATARVPHAHVGSMQPLDALEVGRRLQSSAPVASAPHSRSMSPQIPLSGSEEAIVSSCKSPSVDSPSEVCHPSTVLTGTDLRNLCGATTNQGLYDSVVTYMRTDDASTQLLLAYCYAMSAQHHYSGETATQHRERAHQYFGRGTNILWNRLRDPDHASSDANIQAVLLLVAYTSDFGQPNEVEIHADALRTMVSQRGQVGVISNPTLCGQLESIQSSRKFHLTLEFDHECDAPQRFPHGFWSASRRSSG